MILYQNDTSTCVKTYVPDIGKHIFKFHGCQAEYLHSNCFSEPMNKTECENSFKQGNTLIFRYNSHTKFMVQHNLDLRDRCAPASSSRPSSLSTLAFPPPSSPEQQRFRTFRVGDADLPPSPPSALAPSLSAPASASARQDDVHVIGFAHAAPSSSAPAPASLPAASALSAASSQEVRTIGIRLL